MKYKIAILGSLLTSTLMAQTIVSVNGKNIDEQELFPIVQKITRGQYASLPPEKKQKAQQIALQQAIATALLEGEAQKSNVKSSAEYKKAFVEYIKNVVEPKLMYKIWIDKELAKIKVTNKELKAFYTKNKERLNEPRRSHVYHLLLKTEKEANTLISQISKAKDIKQAFLKVASQKMGGPETGVSDLGELDAKSPMAPAFKAAYITMKAKSMSKKAVKTQFGYHVIYVDSVKGGNPKSFSELKEGITQVVKAEKLEKVLAKKVQALHKKAVIDFK